VTIPAWQLISWKPVLATVPEFRRAVVEMRPFAESDGEAAPNRRQGQALWAARHQGQLLGLAWDWAEVCDHVVALRDPMGVLSNVSLVDEQGELLDEGARIVCLNSAIHELDWQCHVRGVSRAPECVRAMAA
jgi:hypothetical protein